MTRILRLALGLILSAVFTLPAEAINIKTASVQNGLAVVSGDQAARRATVT
jgi:hypothetical protein